jgi:large subunit ribosomal protein L21
MYAVFKSGGKQYRVSKGEKLKLEKLDTEVGKKVVFDQVLSVGEGKDINIGTPYLADTTVEAKVLDEGKNKKIEVVKFKRRKNYKRNFGHRQPYSLIEVTNINTKKKKAAPKKAVSKKTAKKAE